jgi:cobalt-zinc-cadmium efflux system outer membrane protein
VTRQLFLILVIGTLLSACTPSPKHSSFEDVQRITVEKTGQRIQWSRYTIDDLAVATSVRAILAGPLDVDSAVQIALLNNRKLQATFEDLGIAQADVVQAGLLKNPVFDLGVRFPSRPPSRTYIDVNVAEDFISVFFIPAKRKLAEAQFEEAKSRVTLEVLNLAADTKAAFYAYQASQQLVELRRSIAEAMAASAKVTKDLHDAGNTTDLNLLSAKAQDARAKIDLTTAEADAADDRERLGALMGLWDEEPVWKVAGRLPELPAVEVKPDGLETLAIHQRVDLAAARQDVQVQALALGFTAKTRFFSDASIGAEAERETDGQWRIGPSLSLPIPLFDRGQAAVPRAQAALYQSEQRCWALAVDVRSQVRAARMKMFSARTKALFYHDQILPLQNQVVDQTQLEYNGMLVGVFQLLEAKRDQIEAGREYIQALRDYWIDRSDLERAVGGRLPDGDKP